VTSSRIVAIGERARIGAFALAGVLIAAANDADSTLAAWEALRAEAGVVVLTPAAYSALSSKGVLSRAGAPLWTVMPE
jgi:vacuolar-type H+-ATPase subunit F/Vma7